MRGGLGSWVAIAFTFGELGTTVEVAESACFEFGFGSADGAGAGASGFALAEGEGEHVDHAVFEVFWVSAFVIISVDDFFIPVHDAVECFVCHVTHGCLRSSKGGAGNLRTSKNPINDLL